MPDRAAPGEDAQGRATGRSGRTLRRVAGALGRGVVLALRALGRLVETARTRRHLAEMDARMLADIGISRAEARDEASRRFWDTAPPWDDATRRRR